MFCTEYEDAIRFSSTRHYTVQPYATLYCSNIRVREDGWNWWQFCTELWRHFTVQLYGWGRISQTDDGLAANMTTLYGSTKTGEGGSFRLMTVLHRNMTTRCGSTIRVREDRSNWWRFCTEIWRRCTVRPYGGGMIAQIDEVFAPKYDDTIRLNHTPEKGPPLKLMTFLHWNNMTTVYGSTIRDTMRLSHTAEGGSLKLMTFLHRNMTTLYGSTIRVREDIWNWWRFCTEIWRHYTVQPYGWGRIVQADDGFAPKYDDTIRFNHTGEGG